MLETARAQLHIHLGGSLKIKVAPGEPTKVKPEEVINRITPITWIFKTIRLSIFF